MAKTNLPAINLQMPQGVMQKATNVVLLAAAAGGSYLLIKKLATEIKRNSALDDMGKNTPDGVAAQFASQFYSAMISGPEWLSDWFGDGTNEELIFKTAGQMNQYGIRFSDVSRQYKNLYGRDLLQDLQKELSASDYTKFQNALTTGLAGVQSYNSRLQTLAPGYVLNAQFKPVQAIDRGIDLGEHLESFVFADGRVYHGFAYKGNMRYIESSISKTF